MEGEQDEFKRQLQFIIRQLNSDTTSNENIDESDDENDDDDDEVWSALFCSPTDGRFFYELS